MTERRNSQSFTLTFVYDIHPDYARGEKFCSRCQLIHPAGYAPNKCVVCNNTLRTVSRQYPKRSAGRPSVPLKEEALQEAW